MRTGALNKLTASQARVAREGMHSDGGGLFLRVKGSTRAWVFRFTADGRKREMGLGAAASVTLAQARQRAAEARALVANGDDPIAARTKPSAAAPKALTFEQAFRRHLTDHSPTWRNAKHRQQWENSVFTHAKPLLRMRVDEIGPADVADVLSPIWLSTPETARRVRGRIETVLGACIAKGERPGPNPAALRDNLAHILPRQPTGEQRHHAAVPVDDAPAAFARIWARRDEGRGYAALVTVCLTAMRSGEVRMLERGDITGDLIAIPAERMKAKRGHALPMTPFLAAHLAAQPLWNDTALLHPGQGGRPMSNMTIAMAMRRLGLTATVHGWRSTFRDWAGRAGWPRELAEHQLAHAVGDKTERAYARDTLVERRREMMLAWEDYLCTGL